MAMIEKCMLLFSFLLFFYVRGVYAATPISLDEAISMALKNNEVLQLSEQKILSADAKVSQAKAARKLRLNLDSSATRIDNQISNEFTFPASVGTPVITTNAAVNVLGVDFPFTLTIPSTTIALPLPSARLFSRNTSYDAKVSFLQPLYTSGKLEGIIFQARKGKELAALAHKRAKAETVYAVKKAYYGALKAKALADVAGDSITQAKESLKTAQAKLKAGKIPELDVMTADIHLKESYQQLAQAQDAYTLALMMFNHLLGQEEELYEPKDIDEKERLEISPESTALAEYLREAMDKRLEFEELAVSVELAKSGVKVAKTGKKVSIGVSGSYNFTGSEFPPKNKSWSVSLAGTWTLYDSGDTSARVRDAELNVKEADARLAQLKKQVALEVKQAYFKMQEAQKAIKVSQETLEQVKEMLDITKLRYNNGLASGMELLEAETLYARTKAGVAQSVYDYFMAQAELFKAAGR